MKAISVRLDSEQGHWLKAEASRQGVHYSEYVRDLIALQMKEPHFLEYFKEVAHKPFATVSEPKHLIYHLMAYKLLEQLVLNQEEGQQQREAAYTAALEWLERLHPGRKKRYKFNLFFSFDQMEWLRQQSKILNKRRATIIRKIVLLAFLKASQKTYHPHSDLTAAQKEESKAVLMTFTLLKTYIESAYEEGETLVKSCHESAEKLYKKLYPA